MWGAGIQRESEFFAARFDISDISIAEAVVLQGLRPQGGEGVLLNLARMALQSLQKEVRVTGPNWEPGAFLMRLDILTDLDINHNLPGGSGKCC